jgi:hypothetical protein
VLVILQVLNKADLNLTVADKMVEAVKNRRKEETGDGSQMVSRRMNSGDDAGPAGLSDRKSRSARLRQCSSVVCAIKAEKGVPHR